MPVGCNTFGAAAARAGETPDRRPRHRSVWRAELRTKRNAPDLALVDEACRKPWINFGRLIVPDQDLGRKLARSETGATDSFRTAVVEHCASVIARCSSVR